MAVSGRCSGTFKKCTSVLTRHIPHIIKRLSASSTLYAADSIASRGQHQELRFKNDQVKGCCAEHPHELVSFMALRHLKSSLDQDSAAEVAVSKRSTGCEDLTGISSSHCCRSQSCQQSDVQLVL